MERARSGDPVFLSILAFACLVPLLDSAQKAAEWKGRIEKDGDVVVVRNPGKPLYGPGALALEEELAVGGEEGEDYTFASIDSIAVGGDGTIFVLDQKDMNIKVLGRDGKPLRTIGKSGQGPGELSMPVSIHWTAKDELLAVNARGRFSFFKADGKHVRDLSPALSAVMDARPDSAGNYLVYQYSLEAANRQYELRKVDAGLKDLFAVESSPLPDTARDGFNPFFPVLRWALLPDDSVVCGYAVKPEIRIHNPAGKLVRRILMELGDVPVAQEDIDERTEGTPPSVLQSMKIPKHYPAFRFLVTDDEGRIYVLAWERPPGRKGFYFDVLDREGRYVVRALLPVKQPLIRNGRLYADEETGDGYPVLKRYKIVWRL
jgi:hypothetical protein